MICLYCKTDEHDECKALGASVVRTLCQCQHDEPPPAQTIVVPAIESAEEFGRM